MSFLSRLIVCMVFTAAYAFSVRPASAGPQDVLPGAMMSGSPRLLAFALDQPGLPYNARIAARKVLADAGHDVVAGFHQTDTRVGPFLRYDSNLNGGVPFDTISVGGYKFLIDKESVAAAGILVGASADMRHIRGLGNGLAFEAQAGISLGYAPEEKLQKHQAGAQACLRQKASSSLYLHGCVEASWQSVDLGDEAHAAARAGLSKLFAAADGVHEATGAVRFDRLIGPDGFTQPTASLKLLSAWENATVTTIGIDLGKSVEDRMVMKRGVSFGVTKPIAGKLTSLEVEWQENAGGMFLGKPREDRNLSLTVTRAINERLSVSAGVFKTNSSADEFDRSGVQVGVNWRI